MNAKKQAVLFVGHGSPMLITDKVAGSEFRQWGEKLGKPTAILVFSAHWETNTLSFGETGVHASLVYDFYGFPDALYKIQYPAPGALSLVPLIESCLQETCEKSERGLDHGVYVPFMHMWPDSDVPILQMSLPRTFSDRALFELGKKLAPLREQGVLIIGAGALTHNLRAWNPQLKNIAPLSWAKRFDDWVEKTLIDNDIEALLDWQNVAPEAKLNHPTPEHFRPLLVAAGAATNAAISFPIKGFDFGIFTRRSVQFD